MYISPIGYQYNTMKMNNLNFRSRTNAMILQEKVLRNENAKKCVDEALGELNFTEDTIHNLKHKLEGIFDSEISNNDVVEMLLAWLK